jgi:ACS family hexuronate transporter-like MFS transporter
VVLSFLAAHVFSGNLPPELTQLRSDAGDIQRVRVGSIGGGWLSSNLINRGWTVNAARKTAMLVCALSVLPVFYVPYANKNSMWEVGGVLSLAMAAHQGFSAKPVHHDSDMFPRAAVEAWSESAAAMGAWELR